MNNRNTSEYEVNMQPVKDINTSTRKQVVWLAYCVHDTGEQDGQKDAKQNSSVLLEIHGWTQH